MEISTLNYAQRNLEPIAQENGFITYIVRGKLCIELKSGHIIELSEDEIKSRAIFYLQSQISNIENN